MLEMLNASIKKEKEDSTYKDNGVPDIPVPTRIVSLKETKSRKSKGAKGKSSVEKIKVKTLDEIRKEKKIKREVTKGEGEEATSGRSTFIKPTNLLPNEVTRNVAYKNRNICLKPLSVRLMHLPSGQYHNIIPSAKIKQEPVECTIACPAKVSGESSITTTMIPVKTACVENDVNLNSESREEKEIGTYSGLGDESDFNSESSFEQLSSSIDFSDVPRGFTQDDDTMSLFAHDDAFEEESECDIRLPGRHSGRTTRKATKEGDLRETLHNRSIHGRNKEEIDNINKLEEPTVITRKKKNLQQRWEKRHKYCHEVDHIGERTTTTNKKTNNGRDIYVKQQQDPQKYLEELQRIQLLHDVIQGNTHIGNSQVKRGVIPQKNSTPKETLSHLNNTDIGEGTERETTQTQKPSFQHQTSQDVFHLRIRPAVPGGRGFFQDVPLLCEPEVTETVNGNFDNYCSSSLTGDRYETRNAAIDEDFTQSTEVVSFNVESSSKPISPRNRSPKNGCSDYKTLKRRSSGDGNVDVHKQEGPQAPKRSKQVYCTTQIRLGKCHHSFCRLKHLSPSELEELKELGEIKAHQDNSSEHEVLPLKNAMEEEQTEEYDEKEQMCKGLVGAASQALDSMKLCEAWQLINHLYEIAPNNEPAALIKLVERILVLCGKEDVDADIAAQVSSKAFDLIPKVRGNYNRHDFTNLIRCLCQTGQHIRAYEALGEMKALNIEPTHDVFLDLINASQASPDRAFDLLIQIKALGLFRSSICSALLFLSCKVKKPVLERAWSLFKNMVDSSIKPSEESFLALLDVLADNCEGKKILDALIFYDDSSIEPSAKCNKVVINHSKDNVDMVSVSVASVCAVAEVCEPQLDVETWNALLSNCYSENFNLALKAQQIQKLMKKFDVSFLPQGYNGLLCSFSEGNLTMSVMDLFREMITDRVNLSTCKQGLAAVVSALMRAKQVEDLVDVVLILTDNGIMVEEKAFLVVVQGLEISKQYEKINSMFKKCQDAKFALSLVFFRKLISSLEKWAENPAASLEVYAAMKRAYPIIPDCADSSLFGSRSLVLQTSLNPKSNAKGITCTFFLQNKCAYGDCCRFSHSVPAKSSHLDLTNKREGSISERKNPFVLRSGNILPEQMVIPPLPPPPLPPPLSVAVPVPGNPLIPPVYGSNGTFVLKEPVFFPSFQPQSLTTEFGLSQASLLTIPAVSGPSLSQDNVSDPTSIDVHEQCGIDLKTEAQFYKGRIMKATEEQNFEELARLYVEMKNENVPICKEMLQLFYSSFTTFKNIGESLSSFVAIIDIQLDNPDVSDDMSVRESLDCEDQKFIGELGVALMQLCRKCNRLDEGYLVLHVLHQYSINYFQYPASFVPNEKVLSSSSIALLAADMCLCLEKDPQYDGAVEVLRGCNYALPPEGCSLSTEEAEKRRDTFDKVTTHYLGIGNYIVVYEFLQHIGDKDVFGMTHLKSIYNELLKRYIDDKKVEDAIGIIRVMESELISRDTNVLRCLVTCLGSIGRFLQAKEIFKSSCLQGAYPVFPQGEGLWNASIWASFSKFEIQFYLEQHLLNLNRHVEQHRISSQMPYDEKHLRPLRIIIILEDEPNTLSTGLTLEMAKEIQEKIIETLSSDFNPPLSCGVSDVLGEVIVNPRSLRRWFLANPTQDYHSSPTDSDGSGVPQRNVMASKGHLSIRLNVSKITDANSNPNDANEVLLENKSVMEKIKHTICGHLTRYMRNGVISSKEDFKGYARVIAQDYFRHYRDIPTDYNKHQRTKVMAFVDKYFDKSNS